MDLVLIYSILFLGGTSIAMAWVVHYTTVNSVPFDTTYRWYPYAVWGIAWVVTISLVNMLLLDYGAIYGQMDWTGSQAEIEKQLNVIGQAIVTRFYWTSFLFFLVAFPAQAIGQYYTDKEMKKPSSIRDTQVKEIPVNFKDFITHFWPEAEKKNGKEPAPRKRETA